MRMSLKLLNAFISGVVAVLPLAACAPDQAPMDSPPPASTPPTVGPATTEAMPALVSVGTVAVEWLEENNDPVGQGTLELGATLIKDGTAWITWLAKLPAELRGARAAELDSISLDEHVAVAVVWDRCADDARVIHLGGGTLDVELEFDGDVGSPRPSCASPPRRVEVWQVPLDELGVGLEAVSLLG